MAEIHERLKMLRKSLGLSQQQVADEIGIERSTLAGYETGHRTPSLDALLKLAKYYNVSVDYIVGAGIDYEDPYVPADMWPYEDENVRVENYLRFQNAVDIDHEKEVIIKKINEKIKDYDLADLELVLRTIDSIIPELKKFYREFNKYFDNEEEE